MQPIRLHITEQIQTNNAAEEVVITVTVVDTTAPEITLNGEADITIEAGSTLY